MSLSFAFCLKINQYFCIQKRLDLNRFPCLKRAINFNSKTCHWHLRELAKFISSNWTNVVRFQMPGSLAELERLKVLAVLLGLLARIVTYSLHL